VAILVLWAAQVCVASKETRVFKDRRATLATVVLKVTREMSGFVDPRA